MTSCRLRCLASFLFGLSVMMISISNVSAESVESMKKTQAMIVTAHPLATEAGQRVLQQGGTAADAFVAAQAVLGLVEPQSAGLGGGGFAVYYDAETAASLSSADAIVGAVTTWDGREKAPAAATEDRFVQFGGVFQKAWQSGLSVGVPGTPRLMEQLHKQFGRLEWKDLFADAKRLALEGFPLAGRTEKAVNAVLDINLSLGFNCTIRLFFRDPTAFEYFVDPDTCRSKPAGTIMINSEYAATIDALAENGAAGFYEGDIAQGIVDAVQADLAVPGDMTVDDLMNYEVVQRDPICVPFLGQTKVLCGMGPPTSGGLAVAQILGILETFDVSQWKDDPMNVEVVHLFTQANRLAFADRGKYVADSDFVDVPIEGMLNATYLKSRADIIRDFNGIDMGEAPPGTPPGVIPPNSGSDKRANDTGTTHLSIIDGCGNILSTTASIESPFGNGVMVHGFLLNNELTDFSLSPLDAMNMSAANRVEPNKRPRSSMSPTIVFDAETSAPEFVTGSPGGSRIIGYTAQSLWLTYMFGLDPATVVRVPHYQNNNAGFTDLEAPSADNVTEMYDNVTLTKALQERNHTVRSPSPTMDSGLGVIQLVKASSDADEMWLGAADPRREGTVGTTEESNDSICLKDGTSQGEGNNEPPTTSQGEGNNKTETTSQGEGNNEPPTTSQGEGNNEPPTTSQGEGNNNKTQTTSQGEGNNKTQTTSQGDNNEKPKGTSGGPSSHGRITDYKWITLRYMAWSFGFFALIIDWV